MEEEKSQVASRSSSAEVDKDEIADPHTLPPISVPIRADCGAAKRYQEAMIGQEALGGTSGP